MEPGIKEIYMKYTFISTKQVKIELEEDKMYISKWKENYLVAPLIFFAIGIFFVFF